MTTEAEMEIYWKGLEEGKKHAQPSPETKVEIAVLKTKLDTIDQSLEGILTEMSSTKKWLIVTLFSMLFSVGSLFFVIGAWKGEINSRVGQLEKDNISFQTKLEKISNK